MLGMAGGLKRHVEAGRPETHRTGLHAEEVRGQRTCSTGGLRRPTDRLAWGGVGASSSRPHFEPPAGPGGNQVSEIALYPLSGRYMPKTGWLFLIKVTNSLLSLSMEYCLEMLTAILTAALGP